jgi:hypothetical protein
MATGVKISALPDGTAALTDELAANQLGTTNKITTQEIIDLLTASEGVQKSSNNFLLDYSNLTNATAVAADLFSFYDQTDGVHKQDTITNLMGLAPVQDVTNVDSTLTISPTTGNVIASINLSNANTWGAVQTFGNNISIGGATANISGLTSGEVMHYNGTNWVNTDPDTLISHPWTDSSGIIHPTTSATDEVVIGSTTEALADIFLGSDGDSYFNKQGSSTGDWRWDDDSNSSVQFDANANASSTAALARIDGTSITTNGGQPIFQVGQSGSWSELFTCNGASGFGQSVITGSNVQPPNLTITFSVVSPTSSGVFFGGWMASNSSTQQNFGFLLKARGSTATPAANLSGDHLGTWAIAGYGSVIGIAAGFKAYVDTTVGTRVDGRFTINVGKNNSGQQVGLISGDVDERVGIGSYADSGSTKPTLNAKLEVESHEDLITCRLKADAAQTENIFECVDSSDTLLTYIEPDGDIVINADNRGLILGAGQDCSVDWDGSTMDLDVGATNVINLSATQANITQDCDFAEGITYDVETVTGTSATLGDDDYIMLVDDDTAGSDVTITLPAAASHTGRTYYVKKLGTTADVIIDGNASETIDGSTSISLTSQHESVTLVSDATEWWII